ncbi:hypothetical protein FACS1894123_11110 [Bacteroidia bacterium]|jgi:phosphatidylserine/phosphatidylglycerophosphate/cardiolipin synthase-like enzyme|nr:hypothetical protein FACS1894123_11110 [Bacteroidia bacterium]
MLIVLYYALVCAPSYAALPIDQTPRSGAYVNSEGSPLLPLLHNARGKIDIEIYTIKDKTVRTLLRDALKRGVNVRIVKDASVLGETCNVFGNGADTGALNPDAVDCPDQQQFVREVRQAGGVFEPFNEAALCGIGIGAGRHGCFQHGKIALVDGLALISSGNFDSTNLCIAEEQPRTCNRDYSVIIERQDVFNTLEKIFEADLAGNTYDLRSLIPSSLSDMLTVGPVSLDPLVRLLDSARRTIDLEAQYLDMPIMNSAIERAANRGVKVSLTVASACAFGHPDNGKVQNITRVYTRFDSLGISSRMFTSQNLINGRPGYMHAKIIVVDGARAWIGSDNGSTESLTQNREYGFVFDTAPDVSRVLGTVAADHLSGDTETWRESLSCSKDGMTKVGMTLPERLLSL